MFYVEIPKQAVYLVKNYIFLILKLIAFPRVEVNHHLVKLNDVLLNFVNTDAGVQLITKVLGQFVSPLLATAVSYEVPNLLRYQVILVCDKFELWLVHVHMKRLIDLGW